jgi:hypothetical protein
MDTSYVPKLSSVQVPKLIKKRGSQRYIYAALSLYF